jgi:ATP-dependent RNA helicase DeaD
MTALPEGAAPPPPTFDALPLSPEVRRALDVMGYKHPTPVQLAVYEPASRGASLVVQARTGTGKTAAFGLPLLDTLVKRSVPKVQALILTPTRELALQISRELEKIAQFRDVKVTAIYGGASMVKQVEALEGGAQIVAGTPGRVLDHIRRGTLDTKAIKIFVLDEADEMLSMGFAKELSAIADALPKDRQGLFFSATIPPDVERLAAAKLKDPEFITLSSDQVGALEINHFVYLVRGGDKRQQIVRVLETEDPESAIIFCNTKEETERLTAVLQDKGYDAEWLNGDLAQNERERIMASTREGKLRFLVATDVAARGIDISHLTHVINADFPETAEYYVHRTGRTGRAGRTGTAISMVGPKDIGSLYLLRLTYKIRPIEKQLPTDGELKTRSELDVVQLFEEAFGAREAHPDDLALARRLMTHADSEKIIAGLLRDHLGARPGDPKTEAADARRARNPEPIAAPVVEPPAPAPPRAPAAPRPARAGSARGRREPPKRGSPHTDYVTWEPPTESDDNRPILHGSDTDPPPPRFTVSDGPLPARAAPAVASSVPVDDPSDSQIFVNVGRRDGANAVDIQKLLEDRAGISRDETSRIRVRDRNTFVTVKRELTEKAIAALVGQVIGGRTLVAEVARPRT